MKVTMLFGCLFLLIGCSADEKLQPARLIEARGYGRATPQQHFPLPVNGDGIIAATTIIELVFDKPVLEVSINSINAEPDVVPLATVWTLDSRRLDVWIGKTGMLETVSLTINYKDDTGVHTETLDVRLDLQSVTLRVIAVDPKPGSKRTEAVDLSNPRREFPRQEFRITFNEPIIPNSGRIMFGSRATIQLQETEATDTISWNQCFRSFAPVEPDNIGSMVIRDFQNVNGDFQPHPYVGWYWMPEFDLGPPEALEYDPIGQDVDPETTRFIRVVFNEPVETAICEITPAITLSPVHIENDSIKSCTGVVTWKFVGTEQLDYSTEYDVKITADDFAGAGSALENYSFTTKAAPASD